MPACAVETHVHMSEETSEKPRYTENYRKKPRKKAAVQIGPRTQTNTLCEPAQSKRMSREIYRYNAADQSEHPDQAPAFTPIP